MGAKSNLHFYVLISFIIFSSVLGISISMIFSEEKTAYTFTNMLIIVMGFLGGSYVPLSLVKSARITSFLCELVPNYWVNTAILGFSIFASFNPSSPVDASITCKLFLCKFFYKKIILKK